MSRYDWPAESVREKRDDPAGRARFVRPRRTDFDPDGALAASRAPAQPAGRRGGTARPFAPQSGRDHLWQPLGPVTILAGQAGGRPRVSGRVNALAVHPDGDRIYAASANGGVWYSSDGGANWRSVAGLASTNTEGIVRPAQRNACGAIHVEFGSTEDLDTVFLGTGEVTHAMTGAVPQSEGGIGVLVATGPAASGAPPDPWSREARNLLNDGVFKFASGGGEMIAATRTGLYQRPAAPEPDGDWDHPSSAPFDSLEKPCSDILYTPANGGRPERFWVWVKEGDDFGLWVRSGTTGPFAKVGLASGAAFTYTESRAALAASTPATQIWVLNDRGDGTLPALFRVTNPASGAPVAHPVVGVPDILHDSGFYNICLDVDPSRPNRVVLGGSWFGDPEATDAAGIAQVYTRDGFKRGYDAAIVVADVAADAGNGGALTFGVGGAFTMIGIGVHPDVHALAYSNNGARLWTGCDGGVFRSDRPTSPAGFFSRNHGMQISESNFIALHPALEGCIVAGLQDNGVVSRLSNGVWKIEEQGDGGGVVIDPVQPDQWLAQYIHADWNRNLPGGGGPLKRAGVEFDPKPAEESAFYSSAAAIAHTRPFLGNPTPFSQTLIGTDRLWYSDDFGVSWVTLPTGTDPLPANGEQDEFGENITVCRWQNPDVAWVLGDGRLKRYARTPDSHDGGGPGTWTSPPETIIRKNIKNKDDATQAEGPIRESSLWTDIAVNLDAPATPGGPGVQRGTKGALYLGTVGNPDNEDVDTLWWFDGTSKWFPTGLRTSEDGVPAPVTAIVCDPLNPTWVWVGTTVGVWIGERAQSGDEDPTWTWSARVNGLPEAAVEDLQLFRDTSATDGFALLRAAIAARGVWELRLDVVDVQDVAYLRAHDDDMRYRATALDRKRDMGTAPRSWHGSPDVRPRRAPHAVAAPATLPWFRGHPNLDEVSLRRIQSAMRTSLPEPRIVADGTWDLYFSEVLRDHGVTTINVAAAGNLPAFDVVTLEDAFWTAQMQGDHATREPWGPGDPTEADLLELTPALTEGEVTAASCTAAAAPLKVDILVHFRGLGTLDGADVRVTLLRWIDERSPVVAVPDDSRTWFTGPVGWAPAVEQVLNGEGVTGGQTALAVDGGWAFVLGSASESHRKDLTGQTLDPTRPGIATFDFDASGLGSGTVVLFAAIVRAGTTPSDDITLAVGSDLRDLAFGNRNVAIRSMRVA